SESDSDRARLRLRALRHPRFARALRSDSLADRLRSVLPAAVLLDLDGTLIDSESVHAEAIARYMQGCGVELDERERSFVIGHAWQEIFRELRVAERIGVDLVTMQAETERARRSMREEGIHFRVLDGARELVGTLIELEIPTAIVS